MILPTSYEIMSVAMPKTELADLVLYHPRTRPPCRCRPEVQQVFHEATLALKTRECCNESDQFAVNRKERKAHKCIYITVSTGFVLDLTAVKCVRMLKARARAWEWIAPFP